MHIHVPLQTTLLPLTGSQGLPNKPSISLFLYLLLPFFFSYGFEVSLCLCTHMPSSYVYWKEEFKIKLVTLILEDLKKPAVTGPLSFLLLHLFTFGAQESSDSLWSLLRLLLAANTAHIYCPIPGLQCCYIWTKGNSWLLGKLISSICSSFFLLLHSSFIFFSLPFSMCEVHGFFGACMFYKMVHSISGGI